MQNSYLYISFVPLELTSIFTRWHLKSLKMKHDLKTDSQHLTLRFVTKFVMIRKMIWFLFTTDDNSVESTHVHILNTLLNFFYCIFFLSGMPLYIEHVLFDWEAIQSFSCLLYFACRNVLLFQFLVVAHAWLLSFPINGFTYSPK